MRVRFLASTWEQHQLVKRVASIINEGMWYIVPPPFTAELIRTCIISLSGANYDLWIARILLYRQRQPAAILSLCTMMHTAIVLPHPKLRLEAALVTL